MICLCFQQNYRTISYEVIKATSHNHKQQIYIETIYLFDRTTMYYLYSYFTSIYIAAISISIWIATTHTFYTALYVISTFVPLQRQCHTFYHAYSNYPQPTEEGPANIIFLLFLNVQPFYTAILYKDCLSILYSNCLSLWLLFEHMHITAIYITIYIAATHIHLHTHLHMGWLRLVGSSKL